MKFRNTHKDHTVGQVIGVVGMPRCASTMLIELFRQHPKVIAADELMAFGAPERKFFHKQAFGNDRYFEDYATDPTGYLDACQAESFMAQKSFVVKLLDFQHPQAWTWLMKTYTQLIYIRRDFPIEALVSEKYGHAAKTWHARNPEQAGDFRAAQDAIGPLTVFPEEYLAWIRRRERLESLLSDFARVTTIHYSYLTMAPKEASLELFETCGIDAHAIKVLQVKIASKPVWRRVKNYDQLRRAFRDTIYYSQFPDPSR